jgi:hypothetical protein
MDDDIDERDDLTAGHLDEARFGALLAEARHDDEVKDQLLQMRGLSDEQIERAVEGLTPSATASVRRLHRLWRQIAAIDGVEVLELTSGDELCTGHDYRWGVLARAVLDDEAARRAVALFARLPYAMQMRCHVPGYALRFSIAGREVALAALCFLCNNVSIGTPDGDSFMEFDAESPVAQELLALMRAAL